VTAPEIPTPFAQGAGAGRRCRTTPSRWRMVKELFRHRVSKMLLREGKIDEALIKKLLGWRHSGFSIHHQVRINSQDRMGREKLAQYILRSPFSQQKMRYQPKSLIVIYRSTMNPTLKRQFEVFHVLDWIAAFPAHIPNQGEHLVRYYGWYSNVSRGKWKKAQDQVQEAAPEGTVEISPPSVSPALKQRWAQLITKAYEADPLLCPRVGERGASLPSLTSPRLSRRSSPTWGCGLAD
jgi:hypothetical protein